MWLFGGGGARGMAHLLIIDVLERLGITPALVSGTSMGAIAGALYASGNPGKSFLNDLAKSLLYESAEGKGGRKNPGQDYPDFRCIKAFCSSQV